MTLFVTLECLALYRGTLLWLPTSLYLFLYVLSNSVIYIYFTYVFT